MEDAAPFFLSHSVTLVVQPYASHHTAPPQYDTVIPDLPGRDEASARHQALAQMRVVRFSLFDLSTITTYCLLPLSSHFISYGQIVSLP